MTAAAEADRRASGPRPDTTDAGAAAAGSSASRERLLDLAYYGAAALVPFGIIAWLLQLWSFVLAAPLAYSGDGLYYMAEIKGWFETGSYFVNRSLGAPGVSALYDFPSADALNVAILWLFGLFGAEPGTAMNLFYLMGYPLAGLATAFALRRMGLSRIVALAATVLFLFIPYHWQRGEGHLFLGMIWIVPLQVLLAWWVSSSEPPFFTAGGQPTIRSWRTAGAVAISLAAGACGIYYLFFGCFFLVLAGARAAIVSRAWRPVAAAAALIAISAAVFFVQMAPTLLYQREHGPNREPSARTPFEAEIYGLRVTQMLLPIDAHRLPTLAAKRANYRVNSPNGDTEANTAALGVVGSAGLLLAITALLLAWPRDPAPESGRPLASSAGPPRLRWLATLIVGAVLLATASGFGAVFASAATAQIRAYNRISVYVALLAFLLLAVLADRLLRTRITRRGRIIVLALVAAVVVVGLLDQTPATMADSARASAAQYAADAAFGREVQQTLPRGSVVFQLPYVAYPGSPPVGTLGDYDELRGYLHTDGLRWSYGSVKGRPDAQWQETVAALPPERLVDKIRAAGFSTLWVQLHGYEDGGKAVLDEYTALLGQPVLLSGDRGIAAWRL